MDLRKIVWANLNEALENDHDFTRALPERVAYDLKTYASDCARFKLKSIEAHVRSWQAARIAKQSTAV